MQFKKKVWTRAVFGGVGTGFRGVGAGFCGVRTGFCKLPGFEQDIAGFMAAWPPLRLWTRQEQKACKPSSTGIRILQKMPGGQVQAGQCHKHLSCWKRSAMGSTQLNWRSWQPSLWLLYLFNGQRCVILSSSFNKEFEARILNRTSMPSGKRKWRIPHVLNGVAGTSCMNVEHCFVNIVGDNIRTKTARRMDNQPIVSNVKANITT